METPTTGGSPNLPQMPIPDTPVAPSVLEPSETPVAGPSSTPVPVLSRRVYTKKTKKIEGQMAYTSAFVPGMYNIKIPAGDFLTKERNLDVARQMSQAKAKQSRVDEEEDKQGPEADTREIAEQHPLHHTLVIHPGSRNLRIGRASDFYPKEVPNCIARPASAANRGSDPPVPGSRAKRLAARAEEEREAKKRRGNNGDVEMNSHNHGDVSEDEEDWVDPVETNIGHLREYLRNRLVQERLATDWKEGTRVKASNAKVKPENIPEHNDPYRIDWTESDRRPFYIGTEALRLPEKAGYKVRYPLLRRSLNRRDWVSSQLLLDDIATIIQESLRTELGIKPREYSEYSVVFIIPDHGDRVYIQEMTNLLLTTMGFKEIAVHQEAYCAIFSAGMSSACVVDVGAQVTSITCVDEGLVVGDTRMRLDYGGDDITSALVTILQRSNFPYRELDLARSQDWIMMDNLKNKICTLEEHLVANTPWDFHVLRTEGLTQKYVFRTYDENILAPLIFFDTRLIDFKEKKGSGSFRFWGTSDEKTSDEITSWYEEPTAAMRACTTHLLPPAPAPIVLEPSETHGVDPSEEAKPVNGDDTSMPESVGVDATIPVASAQISAASTPAPEGGTVVPPAEATPVSAVAPVVELAAERIIDEAAQSPLDAAIAASIALVGSENKVKAASNSILLIGGGSALKGLGSFIADRLPPLLRRKGFPISDVSIVPPPRNLNPRFVSWKGASVMCNLESLSDMWIGRDEWDALGVRALRDRYLFY